MERAKYLRNLMEKKGYKVADIAKISELPYSTVKYILENGIERASYINVQKICKALGITPDELETMTYNPTTIAAHLDTNNLSPEELNDVASYIEFIRNRKK